MKNKKLALIMGISLCMAVSAPSSCVFAQATETTEEQQEQTEGSDKKETKAEDFQITAGDQTIDVKNETTVTVKEAVYETEENKETGTLTVTQEDGTVHTFKDVTMGSWKDVCMKEEYGFLYINYKDEKDQDVELLETAEEKILDEPVTVYSIDNVNVRSEAKKDSKSLYVTKPGEEATVQAAVPGWLKVKIGDKEGYVYHSFFLDDKEKADEEIAKRQEEKKATQKASAQEATAQEAPVQEAPAQEAPAQEAPAQEEPVQEEPVQTDSSSDQGGQTQEVYEVGRQSYDDCDGSGHGYTEITYSDGSVKIEEY